MIPDWLQEKMANPPSAGAGIHAWLFSVSRQLWAHMDASAIHALLRVATAKCERRVTDREIRDAVQNSREVAWKPTPRDGASRPIGAAVTLKEKAETMAHDRWPRADGVARRCRVADSAAEGVASLYDLWQRSPVRPEHWAADDWLDWLFPGAEWLCLAVDHPATARSRKREKWSFGPAEECGLVVPSPMTGPSGTGLDGRISHRCLDNTGPRRWLVIEFDKLPENPKMDMPIGEQAALHWHFRAGALAVPEWPQARLCVHSGGKSLHLWCGPVESEEAAREMQAYAALYGADTAGWNRCQLMRLPGGVRTNKPPIAAILPDGWPEQTATRQEVFFFDPTPPCLSPINSLAPGAVTALTQVLDRSRTQRLAAMAE